MIRQFALRSFLAVGVALICHIRAHAQPSPAALGKPNAGSELSQPGRQPRASAYLNDIGGLSRYREADIALKPPATGENRVVFFGDSITDRWKLDDYFVSKSYINRGISGQTTSQLLLRLRQDVIELQPKVVVILAGTNDIAGNTGPMSTKDIEANYATIGELARVHNIKVIYSSILPVHDYTEEANNFFSQRPPEKILELNLWLRNYCVVPLNGCTYLDYFAAMVDERGFMKKDLSPDGLHPNEAGYKIMAPLAEAAIEKAIAGGRSQ